MTLRQHQLAQRVGQAEFVLASKRCEKRQGSELEREKFMSETIIFAYTRLLEARIEILRRIMQGKFPSLQSGAAQGPRSNFGSDSARI